jgi:putative PIN family toxin of toxin-antitoxin system
VVVTNVLVSAVLFPSSIPGRALAVVLSQGELLTSVALAEELRDVLSRSKFDRYLTQDERDAFLSAFIEGAILVPVVEALHVCRDPSDDRVLEAAVSGRADFVMTGDEDLLALDPFRTIRIVTPSEFLTGRQRPP